MDHAGWQRDASDETSVGGEPAGEGRHHAAGTSAAARKSLRYGAWCAAHATARVWSLIQLALSTHEAPK